MGPKTTSECRSCGEAGYWVRTEAGKNVLVNESDELADFWEAYGPLPVDRADEPTLQDLWEALGRDAVQVHFSTCPEADEHRRGPSR